MANLSYKTYTVRSHECPRCSVTLSIPPTAGGFSYITSIGIVGSLCLGSLVRQAVGVRSRQPFFILFSVVCLAGAASENEYTQSIYRAP